MFSCSYFYCAAVRLSNEMSKLSLLDPQFLKIDTKKEVILLPQRHSYECRCVLWLPFGHLERLSANFVNAPRSALNHGFFDDMVKQWGK